MRGGCYYLSKYSLFRFECLTYPLVTAQRWVDRTGSKLLVLSVTNDAALGVLQGRHEDDKEEDTWCSNEEHGHNHIIN